MFSYFCLFAIIIFSWSVIVLFKNYLNKSIVFKMIIHFSEYASVLEYHMQKAYDIIYKDRILIYSLEAIKINDKDFKVISKDFALLAFKLFGPNLKDEFIKLYGNEETLIFVMMEYFNSKFEEDEIRKKASEGLMDTDTDESITNNNFMV
jgi:hypothetical protein